MATVNREHLLRGCGVRHSGPCPPERLDQTVHGVECYEAWRAERDCPHEAEAQRQREYEAEKMDEHRSNG